MKCASIWQKLPRGSPGRQRLNWKNSRLKMASFSSPPVEFGHVRRRHAHEARVLGKRQLEGPAIRRRDGDAAVSEELRGECIRNCGRAEWIEGTIR